jgi:transglutaminase-like putative cysteine protease
LEPTQRDWVFALDMPTTWPEGLFRLADMQLVSRRPISTLSSFNLQSHTRYRTPPELSAPTLAQDTALPGVSNPRTRAFAKELRAASRNDVDFVQAVLDKFTREQFFYTLAPPLLGDNSVDEFLFDTRRGFCEHYASAFTVLMRAAKIPSRIVTGYQGGEYNSLGDYLLVKQSDAHAWSEVWLPNQGWVRIDPTAAVSPQRIERNLDAAIADNEAVPGRFLRNNFFFSRTRLTWDAVNNFWNNRIVEYDELKQRSLLALVGVQNTDYRTLGIAIGLSLLLFFASLTVYLGWQYRPRKRDPIVVVYDELCRKLARVNLPRQAHEGSSDYLRRVALSQPALAAELGELRDLYASLRYGPDALNSELSRLKYLVNRLQPQVPAATRTTEIAA